MLLWGDLLSLVLYIRPSIIIFIFPFLVIQLLKFFRYLSSILALRHGSSELAFRVSTMGGINAFLYDGSFSR